jgi:hypothetical protein
MGAQRWNQQNARQTRYVTHERESLQVDRPGMPGRMGSESERHRITRRELA